MKFKYISNYVIKGKLEQLTSPVCEHALSGHCVRALCKSKVIRNGKRRCLISTRRNSRESQMTLMFLFYITHIFYLFFLAYHLRRYCSCRARVVLKLQLSTTTSNRIKIILRYRIRAVYLLKTAACRTEVCYNNIQNCYHNLHISHS